MGGNFTLTTGKGTTTAISFSSYNLASVAANIKAALVALGYSPSTSVTINYSSNTTIAANATSPYTFTIAWSSADTASGLIPLVTCTTAMNATVTVAYGDGKPLAGASTQILKESSDAFRVNDPETVWDPSSANRPQRYNQSDAQVAMDADGDFVITWQGYTPDSVNVGSGYDIYARRFSPAGYVDQFQYLQFTPNGSSSALSGTFTVTTGKGTTASINFDSTNLGAAATSVATGPDRARLRSGDEGHRCPAGHLLRVANHLGRPTIRRSRSRWCKSTRRRRAR